MYDMARHDPSEFGSDEYEAYRRLLLKLLDAYVDYTGSSERSRVEMFMSFVK